MTKKCAKCDQPGSFQISKNTRGVAYESTICRTCKNASRRAWKAKRGAKGRKQANTYMRSYAPGYRQRAPEKSQGTKQWARLNPEKYLFNKMQKNTRVRGLVFDFTLAEFLAEIGGEIPKICPVLGIEIKIGDGRGDDLPSVDRLDSSRPYEKGNIAIISLRANLLKRDGTADEHRKIAAWMDRQ